MNTEKQLTAVGLAALVFILLLTLVMVLMGVGTFVVPSMLAGWKTQGMQVPLFWQIIVDLSDFCNHRWYIVLPILLIGSIVLSVQAVRQRR